MEVQNLKSKKKTRRNKNIELEIVSNSRSKSKSKSRSMSKSPEFIIEVYPRKKTEKPLLKPKKKTLKKKNISKNGNEKKIESFFDGTNDVKEDSNKSGLKETQQIVTMEQTRYNEKFIDLMEKLSSIMLKQGEPFRARAYQKAQETVMAYPNDIVSVSQLKGLPGIGSTIMDKLNEYVETGTLRILEREKNNPINILGEIYGIGPKKAQELVSMGITTIEKLEAKQHDVLNDIQRVGLKYNNDIQERIPRCEIEKYNELFASIFDKLKTPDSKFEIVGSYRRGALSSGDIDVIITGNTGVVYKAFIDELIKHGIILEVLSRGPSKTLVIAKLPCALYARRVDFLYTPPDEFAFAILYFTGSKIFNTVMRQRALDRGYTLNEHGIYVMKNKTKGEKVGQLFLDEKSIFDFLGMQYKAPEERIDGRAVVAYNDVGTHVPELVVPSPTSIKEQPKIEVEAKVEPEPEAKAEPETKKPKNKTLKKKKTSQLPENIEFVVEEDEIDVSDTDIHNIIEDFKHHGIKIVEHLNERVLSDIIRYANKAYYNQTPVMTDNQYDIIKEYMESKYPSHAVITEIGAEVERNKVTLPYEMASMDKIKPDTSALANWMAKFTGPYVLSCKLDGVSGLYSTEGNVPKLYTRGNGKVGQDVSHLIPHLRLPKTKNIVIRGEFIIPKAVFEQKYKSAFANPRNMVAGIVNNKTITDSVQDLHFVAYEIIKPQLSPSQQMEMLGTINVERVLYQTSDTLSNEMLSNLLVDWRKNYIYEIDGVIVTNDRIYPRKSGNPEHAFAFKMVLSDQVAEAKVVDVLWTPSKDGYLKPRVQIEPIHLGGVTIEYATGFNGSFIKNNNIGIGATIEIIRSGDVIPYIRAVTVPAPSPKMPSVPFKWNDTHVDVLLENALEDSTVREKNITGFFRGIEVEGLSSGNVARIIEVGFDTVPKILKMTEADFLTVPGFKSKMANKIYTAIHEKINQASLVDLMSASNLFGRGFSSKKLELIMQELPDILVSTSTHEQKVNSVANIKGMAVKTAQAFVEHIDDFVDFLKEIGLENKLYQEPKNKIVVSGHPLFGKTIVLTGTRDKTVIEIMKNVGANQGSNVSKNTFLVIAKDVDEDTGKAEEARKLNIPIMTPEQFIKTYQT